MTLHQEDQGGHVWRLSLYGDVDIEEEDETQEEGQVCRAINTGLSGSWKMGEYLEMKTHACTSVCDTWAINSQINAQW